MTADAQIMKGALRPLLIALTAPGVSRIALAEVTGRALHQYRHSAELSALVMTADALGALLRLMSKLIVGIEISFVMLVPKRYRPTRSFYIELDYMRARVVGFDSIAVSLIGGWARQHSSGHRKDCQNCQLKSHQKIVRSFCLQAGG